MGPIAQAEVVNFWPTRPARVQTVQELAPPPPRFWPIAHFPIDFSRNPPYNPPYAPLRSSRSSPHAGHGVSYRSASRTPSPSSGAEASEAQPSRRERTQARRQAAPSTPPQRIAEPLPGLLPPCPAGPSSARVGPIPKPPRVARVSGNPPVLAAGGVRGCEAPSGGVGGDLAACGSGRRGPGRRAVAGLGAGGDARSGPRRRRERGLQVVRLTSEPCERSRWRVRASWRAVRGAWRRRSGEREGGGQRSGPDARSASRWPRRLPRRRGGRSCAPDCPTDA